MGVSYPPKLRRVERTLKNYVKINNRIDILKLKIEELETQVEYSGNCNTNPYKSNNSDCNKVENKLSNYVTLKEEYQKRILKLESERKKVDIALNILDDEEREIIEGIFLKRFYIKKLTDVLYRSESTIKRIKKRALEKMFDVLFRKKDS